MTIQLDRLARMLREKRDAEGLTLRDAADQVGMNNPVFYRYETEQVRRADAVSVALLSDWLGLTVEDFIVREGEEEVAA